MRHGKKLHKLSRPAEHRKALLNNLATALITYKKIETTDRKAKVLKPYIDRLISTARQNTLHARRRVAQSLPNKSAVKELFSVVVPKLEGRTSGFSRIVKYRTRRGDGASMSIIELLMEKEVEEKDKKKGKKKAAVKPKAAKKTAKPKASKAKAVEEEPVVEVVEETAEAAESVGEVEEIEETVESPEEGSEPEEKSEEDKKD